MVRSTEKKVYSHDMITPKFLAPAATQVKASDLIFARRTVGGALLSWKIQAFLSFQMVQEVTSVRVAITFRFEMIESEGFVHQSLMERAKCQMEVSMLLSWSHSLIIPQSLTEYLHLNMRCSMDSCSRLHRGQSPQLGHPRLANRSAVQTLFCIANHAKKLTFGGAQAFQTVSSIGERRRPKNRAK